MDRKTQYGKQHGDRQRSANPYFFYRKNLGRIKYPILAFSMFLLFFVSAQTTGDLWKADVFQALDRESITFTSENLEIAKKGMLILLDSELKDCEALKLDECAAEAKNTISQVALVSQPESAKEIYAVIERLIEQWDAVQKKARCEQNFEKTVQHLEEAVSSLQKVDAAKSEDLQKKLDALKSKSPCS